MDLKAYHDQIDAAGAEAEQLIVRAIEEHPNTIENAQALADHPAIRAMHAGLFVAFMKCATLGKARVCEHLVRLLEAPQPFMIYTRKWEIAVCKKCMEDGDAPDVLPLCDRCGQEVETMHVCDTTIEGSPMIMRFCVCLACMEELEGEAQAL